MSRIITHTNDNGLEVLHIEHPDEVDCLFMRAGIDAVRAVSSRNITFSSY